MSRKRDHRPAASPEKRLSVAPAGRYVLGAAVTAATAYGISVILPGALYQDTRGVVWKRGVAVREPEDTVRWNRVYVFLALYAAAIIAVLAWIGRRAG